MRDFCLAVGLGGAPVRHPRDQPGALQGRQERRARAPPARDRQADRHALGTMKGAAMKLGQIMSFLDFGLVPEENREEFQPELGELRDAAPNVVHRHAQGDRDRPLGAARGDLRRARRRADRGGLDRPGLPRAAADGRDVAVKVQYLGVADAARPRHANLGALLRLTRRMPPGSTSRPGRGDPLADRRRARLRARGPNQRAMARIYRVTRSSSCPRSSDLSREQVMVTEYVSARFETFRDADQASATVSPRSSSASTTGPCTDTASSRRAAPRQLLLCRRPRGLPGLRAVQGHAAPADRARAGDPARRPRGRRQRLREIWAEGGLLREPDRFRPDKLLSQFLEATWWYLTDEEIALGPEVATQVMIDMSDPRSEHFGQCATRRSRPTTSSAAASSCSRWQCSASCARHNWHRIAREWIYGDDPVTELGREEAAFYCDGSASGASAACRAPGCRRRTRRA